MARIAHSLVRIEFDDFAICHGRSLSDQWMGNAYAMLLRFASEREYVDPFGTNFAKMNRGFN